jgi:DNA topoisomerase-3
VLETAGAYICEKSQAASRPCKFKASRTILGQTLDRAELGRLLKDGRTDLLTQFVSKSGKPFSAFLVLQDGGKVGFEFPSR